MLPPLLEVPGKFLYKLYKLYSTGGVLLYTLGNLPDLGHSKLPVYLPAAGILP
jgi:hypothetical protein